MAAFQYEALKISDRSKTSGIINASNEKEARELLREQELIPTKMQVIAGVREKVKGNPVANLISNFMGVGVKDKIAFTRNLAMMIRSGIPLTEGLLYFENYCKNAKFKSTISQIRRDILSGYSFSQALAKHKSLFNEAFITITQAGEKSGELEETMNRLTEMLINTDKLKMKVISAAVYPCVVIAIALIVMAVMFIVVLPTFADIYKKLGVELPMITIVMMSISSFLKDGWFISFPLLGFSCFGLFKYFTSDGGRTLLDRYVLKVPVLGDLVLFINNSYFISTLHIAFGAGLPILEALYLATQTVRNSLIKEALQKVHVQIQTGQRLAVAMAQTGFVPDLVLLMISIGEESGELEKMLENSFEYLDSEVNHKVGILTTMMEPLLLMVLGVLVGGMALSIYLPLYSMYKHL